MNAVRSRDRFHASRSLFAATSLLCLVSTASAQQNEPRVQWKYAPKGSQFEDVLLFVTTRRHNDDGESAVIAIKLP